MRPIRATKCPHERTPTSASARETSPLGLMSLRISELRTGPIRRSRSRKTSGDPSSRQNSHEFCYRNISRRSPLGLMSLDARREVALSLVGGTPRPSEANPMTDGRGVHPTEQAAWRSPFNNTLSALTAIASASDFWPAGGSHRPCSDRWRWLRVLCGRRHSDRSQLVRVVAGRVPIPQT